MMYIASGPMVIIAFGGWFFLFPKMVSNKIIKGPSQTPEDANKFIIEIEIVALRVVGVVFLLCSDLVLVLKMMMM